MKSIKLLLFVFVLLFTVSVSAQADAAMIYSDGTETAALTSLSSEKATLQYCGIEANFSIFPQETNSLIYTYLSDTCDDKFTISCDGQQMMLAAFQFNKVVYPLYLVSADNGNSSSSNTYKSPCYACQGRGYCIVCMGTGRYSNYGQPSVTCSACGGKGKCPRCDGTGRER